ncbi:hypothetical protein C1646_742550 [Rhizophagus diaphanus]|nr:hypothetical protein C1646_742550 [Rhizophagus diaphanus] [Rhizophagus sp. MUCL 43196]
MTAKHVIWRGRNAIHHRIIQLLIFFSKNQPTYQNNLFWADIYDKLGPGAHGRHGLDSTFTPAVLWSRSGLVRCCGLLYYGAHKLDVTKHQKFYLFFLLARICFATFLSRTCSRIISFNSWASKTWKKILIYLGACHTPSFFGVSSEVSVICGGGLNLLTEVAVADGVT